MNEHEGSYITFVRKMMGVFCDDLEDLVDAAYAAARRVA